MKLILGIGKTLEGRLLLYNGEDATTRVLKLRGRVENCPCGTGNTHQKIEAK